MDGKRLLALAAATAIGVAVIVAGLNAAATSTTLASAAKIVDRGHSALEAVGDPLAVGATNELEEPGNSGP